MVATTYGTFGTTKYGPSPNNGVSITSVVIHPSAGGTISLSLGDGEGHQPMNGILRDMWAEPYQANVAGITGTPARIHAGARLWVLHPEERVYGTVHQTKNIRYINGLPSAHNTNYALAPNGTVNGYPIRGYLKLYGSNWGTSANHTCTFKFNVTSN